MNILFWNLGRQLATLELVCALVQAHEVDVVLLAEQPGEMSDAMIADLLSDRLGPVRFTYAFRAARSRICALSRLSAARFHTVQNDDTFPYATVYALDGCTLVAAHLVSRRNADPLDQAEEATRLGELIRRFEDRQTSPHRRTVLVGDLNMDPFDDGLVKASGLHALSARGVSRRETRRVKHVDYPIFYNPMWGLWGDATPGPPGTYFFNRSGHHVNRFWHMIDQVLVRPALIDALTDLRVVDAVDGRSLASPDGRPAVSDHFPLLFSLELSHG